jgi:hypothetical protein
MNKIDQAKEAMHAISAALEADYPDNSPVWAHVEDVAEVINGTAPELLEALELCRDALDNTATLCGCGECGTCEAYNKARAAIAKAKGGAQ